MKFLKSTLVTFFTNIFIFGLSFFSAIIISRGLGPDGRGVLSISNNTIAILIIFLGFGIEASNVFFIGKDKKNINNILCVNIIISITALIGVTLLYLFSLRYPIKFFKGLDSSILLVTLLTIPVLNLKSSFMNSLLGLQEVIGYNKMNILDRVTNFILMVIFIITFRSPFWLVVSNYLAIVIVLTVLSYVLFRRKGFRLSFNRRTFREMVGYGLKNQVGNIIQFINYRLDVFIINMYLPVAQVGIYSNAVALGETIWQVSGSVATVVFPMTTNSENKLEMKEFINKTTRITFYIVLTCSIILVAISKPFILFVFGPEFVGSADALVYLIPGISVFSISKILANYIAGIGLVEKNIISSVISGAITVTLDLILIPRAGIVGAALASSISYMAFTFITLGFYMNITKSSLRDVLILRREDLREIKGMFARLFSRFGKK